MTAPARGIRRLVTTAALVALALLAGCGGAGGSPSGGPAVSLPPALPAGTYTSAAFRPPVTFILPAGWWVPSDAADYLGLQPVASDLIGIHFFRDPLAASQDPACPTIAEPGVGTRAADLSGWIRGLDGLVVSNPRLVTVSGLPGIELDVAIVAGWTMSCPFAEGLPTVPLFVGDEDGFRWVVAGNERLRLTLLDVPGGGTVVVDIDAFDGSLMDRLMLEAGPIVQGLSFASTP